MRPAFAMTITKIQAQTLTEDIRYLPKPVFRYEAIYMGSIVLRYLGLAMAVGLM